MIILLTLIISVSFLKKYLESKNVDFEMFDDKLNENQKIKGDLEYANLKKNDDVIVFKKGDIEVRRSNISGRGVFTKSDIKGGEIIEQCPLITDTYKNACGEVNHYIFAGQDPDRWVLPFGYGAVYNHRDENNATWKINGDVLSIVAVKDIKPNEEIFVNYGSQYWSSREKYYEQKSNKSD